MQCPTHARIVIVGAGVIGSSVAYHLGSMGIENVVLLERHQVGSGTTWHSAGNIALATSDPVGMKLQRYALDLFPKLESETGLSVGWHSSGRIVLLSSPESLARAKLIQMQGKAQGVEMDIISGKEAGTLLPVVNTRDVPQALWIPSAGKLSPTDLTTVYTRAARNRGVCLLENTSVTGFDIRDGRVRGVRTNRGSVQSDIVVNCGGVWARELGAMAGVAVPVAANEHFYLLTAAVPGVTSKMPSFRDGDSLIYGREESGGLLLGVFDEDARPLDLATLPPDFSFGLLPENWDQVTPYMADMMHRVPALADVPIKSFINGPEGFTIDDRFIIGEAACVRGYFVCAGMNSGGVTYSAGFGKLLAEWIVAGRPSEDISMYDLARFQGFEADPDHLRTRSPELTSRHYRFIRGGMPPYQLGRNVLRSPLHDDLVKLGAQCEPDCGWERPAWFQRSADDTREACVYAEREATKKTVAVFDQSPAMLLRCSKLLLRSIRAPLNAKMPDAAIDALAVFQTASGAVIGRHQVLGLDGDECLIIADPGIGPLLHHTLVRQAEDMKAGRIARLENRVILQLIGPCAFAVLGSVSADVERAANSQEVTSFDYCGEQIQVAATSIPEGAILILPATAASKVLSTVLKAGRNYSVDMCGVDAAAQAWREALVEAFAKSLPSSDGYSPYTVTDAISWPTFYVMSANGPAAYHLASGMPILDGDDMIGYVRHIISSYQIGESFVLAALFRPAAQPVIPADRESLVLRY